MAELQSREKRGSDNVPDINKAREDPFRALAKAYELLTSVLRQASRRDLRTSTAWIWVVVHLIDALALHIEKAAEPPDPWFEGKEAHWLNPAGWGPLIPLKTMLQRLTRAPEQEAGR